LPPETKPYEEEIFFLVATLYPLTESGGKGNFGAAMRRIRPTKDDEAQGLDRLMQLLLDAQGERLSFLLRQSVRRLADHEIPVNWPNLLADLLKWNDRERRVQNRWARNYFLNTKERKLLASAPQNAEQI
jgi:CRISPR type I-E-associated protein CasB/Cse2